MARPAPSVARTVALLDFLALHRGEAFSLSQLAHHLELNKATAHAMLSALTEAAYLVRHPVEKVYTLGPALVAVGDAAAATRPIEVTQFAREAMRSLVDEFGVQCTASAALGSSIVILACSGAPEPLSFTVQVGQRLPFVPPLGTVFVAWSSPAEIDTWLRRVGASAREEELERYRAALATVRQRGYSVGLEAEARVRLAQAITDGEPRLVNLVNELGQGEYLLLDLEHAASYRLSMLSAPVFGPNGQVEFALTLLGFGDPIRSDRLARCADRLVCATRTVTAAIRGREPRRSPQLLEA